MEEQLCQKDVEEDEIDIDKTDSDEYMSEFLDENGEYILNQVDVWMLISNETNNLILLGILVNLAIFLFERRDVLSLLCMLRCNSSEFTKN